MSFWYKRGVFKPVEIKEEAKKRSLSKQAKDLLHEPNAELRAVQIAYDNAEQVTENNTVQERIQAFAWLKWNDYLTVIYRTLFLIYIW